MLAKIIAEGVETLAYMSDSPLIMSQFTHVNWARTPWNVLHHCAYFSDE